MEVLLAIPCLKKIQSTGDSVSGGNGYLQL